MGQLTFAEYSHLTTPSQYLMPNLNTIRQNYVWLFVLAACAAALLMAKSAIAQDASSAGDANSPEVIQANLAQRFERLELLAGRLAELSRTTQPGRAKLLRELVARSRQRDVPGRFKQAVKELEAGRFSAAVDAQQQLQTELTQLLELLLQEDRDRQIESERKRIARYLQELNKVIRSQRGVKARTEGGDDSKELAEDQGKVRQATEDLQSEIQRTEGAQDPSEGQNPSEGSNSDGSPKESPSQPDSSAESESSESSEGGESAEGESEGESSPSSPSNSSSPSNPSESSDAPESAEQQSAPERAVESLKRARQRMEQAQKDLDRARRDGAAEKQQEALRELEQARAELEEILRQLREEELERLLVMLEARFRKMLQAQVEVYEETKKLEAAEESAPVHEMEIAGGRLSRKELQIVRDADRALMLLREDGTSAAFPEAVRQARADMKTISERLAKVKVGLITQGLEEDVIASLEETLAALQQALSDLREQRSQQQQGSGQPGEQRLVDQLAELRMIRALQLRVNRRTERYGALVEGEQAEEEELLDALKLLAEREQRILEATKDLHMRQN